LPASGSARAVSGAARGVDEVTAQGGAFGFGVGLARDPATCSRLQLTAASATQGRVHGKRVRGQVAQQAVGISPALQEVKAVYSRLCDLGIGDPAAKLFIPDGGGKASPAAIAALSRSRCLLLMVAATCQLLRVSELYGCFDGESPDLLAGLCGLVRYG
jgi:hypothetical protein